MRFTSNEMMFLHSITPGENVFGFRFFFPSGKAGEEAEEETLRGLVKKGVLESKDKLSKQGVYPAKAMEDYKNSRKHVILNYLHLALSEDGNMVMIYPVEKEYELCTIKNGALFFLMVKKFSFLRERGRSEEIVMEQTGLDTILKELNENENNIIAGEYLDGKPVSERVFYQKENDSYIYDFVSGRRYKTDGYRIRMELGKLLQIEGEQKYGRNS